MNITIPVKVNFAGVTRTSDSSWSSSPTWVVPNVEVTDRSVITWELQAVNVPPGLTAIFANGDTSDPTLWDKVNPIQFLNPDPPGPMLWPYQQPTRQPDGLHVTVTDDFTTAGDHDYEYYIWVILTDATGAHLMPQFHIDPDIENRGKKRFLITVTAPAR